MNKFKRRVLALFSLFSFLINFSSLGFPLIVLAQEIPSPTPVPLVEEVQEETQENNGEDETLTTPTPEPEPTLQEDIISTSDDSQNQLDSNLIDVPFPSPLASYEPSPSATILPQEVSEGIEKVCLGGEEIKETTNDDWQIDLEKGVAETKEKVRLGVKYVFPQENKVTVTFRCLPKDESLRTSLKIQRIKVSDLKLPEGVKPATDYAYDMTTGMEDGTFEYDVTLPKPENQEAKVSYMEDINSEVKTIEEGKINQGGDKVKVKGLDPFSIYLVTVAPDGTDGVTPGQNFCSASCHLVPIYDGAHTCPQGTVKSQSPILSKTISAIDADGETFSLTSGGKYLFEALGTYRPTDPKWYPDPWADAGYTTLNGWPNLATQYGIEGIGNDYAAHALLADLGNGVGVVDWGDYNSDHIYTKYYEPTSNNVQFVIGDRYGYWFNTPWQNQTGMNDNSGNLTLNVYECQPVSTVTLCKNDTNQNPLPGWRLYLLGQKVGSTINIPSNGSVINAGSYPTDNYVLLASGVYNYDDSRMNADAASSYRYVGLPCAGTTDGWVNGEALSCMNNYLSLNFSTSSGPTAPGWGTYYNPQHKYAKSFSGGNLDLKIWDTCNFSQLEGCYGDNEGSLQLDIYKGYVGDTGNDGCVAFANVPYGNYQFGEILQDGWQEATGSGNVIVDNSQEVFTIVNNQLPKFGNLQVTKIVDWKNTNPDQSKTFEICIAGPSYPNGNCQTSDYDGEVLSWNNIEVGEYTITEANPGSNWIVTGSGGKIIVNENQNAVWEIKNEVNPVVIKAYKIVCNSEVDLPNWSGGADITQARIQDFMNSYSDVCHYEADWDFQWGFADKAGAQGVDKLIGTHIGPADGTPSSCSSNCGPNTQTGSAYNQWKTFGPTDASGEAVAMINDLEGAPGILVRENLKAGYVPFTYPPQASPGSNISAEMYCHTDVQKYDNYDQIISPQYGQTYYCVAFNAPYPKVSGYKFEDKNGNGIKDEEDTGLSDWTIYLAKRVDELNIPALNSPSIPSNISLENGKNYLIRAAGTYFADDNITADAKYSVRAPNTLWTDYVQNYESYGPNLLDLQIDGNSLSWGNYNPTHTYWLAYTGTGSPINFRLNDFYPSNNNGEINVKIYEILSSTTTNSDGSYSINIDPTLTGEIIVAEQTQEGYVQTAPTGENFGYCLVQPTNDSICNFGNQLKSSTGTIIVDKVTSPSGSDQNFDILIKQGNYNFFETNIKDTDEPVSNTLPLGYYSVSEVQIPPRWKLDNVNCLNGETQVDPDNIILTGGEEVICTFTNSKLGYIQGMKYNDLNNNGNRNGGEPYLDGWAIRGYKKDGSGWNLIGELTTGHAGVNGQYRFEGLTLGRYKICEVLQSGWAQTSPTGTPNNIQSDEAPRCRVIDITTSGEYIEDEHFGNIQYGRILGHKYDEDGETGLVDWTIFIDEDGDKVLGEGELSYLTDNNGYFEFVDLVAGTYSVCEVEKSGWQRMYPLGTNCQEVGVVGGEDSEIYFQNRQVVLDLSLTKSNDASGALDAGSNVNYTLVIENTGNQRLTGVTIKDAPAGGFTYVSNSGSLDGNPISPTILSGFLEWYIGTLEPGEKKTLTYTMQTANDLASGVYPNIAIATGIYTPYEYEGEGGSELVNFRIVEVLAVTEELEGEKIESNTGIPVNSEVELKQVLAYSVGVGGIGQVLGASTEAGQVLPAAGSDTRFLIFAILCLLLGLLLKISSLALAKGWVNYHRLRKGLKNVFTLFIVTLAFFVLTPLAKAFSDYVFITKLSSYINKEDFKISYSALSENPISAQFYVRKDGDSSWRNLGSALSGASGYVNVGGSDIYNGDGKYFFKVVINGGTTEDVTSIIIDRQAPDSVRDYRKEKLGDGHYKLYWKNPGNDDFDKVVIYRSDKTNFTADSSTEVATIWGSKDAEMTSENSAAPGKEYYFAIRAIDKAGNASGVVSDPETQVTVGEVLGVSEASPTSQETEVVKLLPKEKKKGEILGAEVKTEEEAVASPSPTEFAEEQKGSVLGEAFKFAKDRTKLTFGIVAVLFLGGYFGIRKIRSKEK